MIKLKYGSYKKLFHKLMILLFVVLLISPAPNTVTNAENGLKKNYVTADVVDEETKDAEERSELPTESDKQEVVTENGEEEVIEEFDESNTDSALEESEFVDESEDQGKHKKEEQDKGGESLLEKAVDGMKEFAGSVLSKFQLTSSEPQYVMATDADFSGTSNGNFRYTGSAEYVEIPHKIKGVPVTSYRSMFQSTSVKGVKSTNENITDMSYMFAWNTATSLDLSNLNTSKVTNMESMFYDSKANSIDLSNFDTSKVTNMKNMFARSKATSLDLSNFNTSNVTDMSYMFFNTEATTLDISSFDTSNVIDMSYMFNVSNATTLDLSNFNTSNVINMKGMFDNSKATSLDLSNFNTSQVTDMSNMFTLSKATTLNIANFDTSNVTNMKNMFSNSKVTSLDLSHFNTSNVVDMSQMFLNSRATVIDLSGFDTSNVTDMTNMFQASSATKGYARTQEDANRFKVSSGKPARLVFRVKSEDGYVLAIDEDFEFKDDYNGYPVGIETGYYLYIGDEEYVEIPNKINGHELTSYYKMFDYAIVKGVKSTNENITNMRYMFLRSKASELDLSKLNTSNVTDMYGMFQQNEATQLNVSGFDTSNVTTMRFMFFQSKARELDLSNFNTSNVTDMFGMFENSKATKLNVSSFDTRNVTDMGRMFDRVQATQLNISNFDTSNVTNMSLMFNLSEATSLDLSNFNTSNVTNMSSMFLNSKARELNLSSFDTRKVTDMSNMFYFSQATELDLSSFEISSDTNIANMFRSSRATIGFAKTREYADRLNNSTGKPEKLNFVVKGLPNISFEKNGDDNFQKTHRTKVGVEIPKADIESLEYIWTTSETPPENGWMPFEINDEIIHSSGSGDYYLHVRATSSIGKTSIETSNVFKFDNTKPTLNLSHEPTEYTSGDVTITVTASDVHSGIKRIKLPDNQWINDSTATYLVKENATYTFEVEDNAGNVTTKSIEVLNIDKLPPTIELSKNGGDWAKSHTTVIDVTDDESGVDHVEYVWSTSTEEPTGSFTEINNNGSVKSPDTTGDYYLHVRARDNVGNMRKFTSKSFKVDVTAPTAPTISAATGWQKEDVTVTLTDGEDSDSGVDYSEYSFDGINWEKYTTPLTISENGEITVLARTIDNAGNMSAITSETIKIDKTLPKITLTQNGGVWEKPHTTSVKVTDMYSGVAEIEYVWSTSEDFPTSGFTSYSNGVEISTPNESGIYYLHVRATDHAGNMSEFTSEAFKIDVTAPTAPTIDAPESWQNMDVTVKITDGQDEHSGVNRTEYRINDGPWTVYNDEFAISTEGETMIEAKTFDHVSNESSTTSVKILIDKVNPTLTITQSPTEPTHDEVVLEVNATDDRSGVKQITLPDGTTVTEKETIFIAKLNGTYKFIVEDNAGNKHTELIEITNIDKSSTVEIPGSLDFGNVKLIDKPQVITADIPPIIVKDWRDAPNEWSLHVSASPVKLENENFFLPTGTIQLNALDHVMRIKGSGDMPAKQLIAKTALDDGEVTVVQSMNSRGEYKLEFPSQALEITIDPTTTKAGKYESTMTWKLVTAP